jgi:hypothetical protein
MGSFLQTQVHFIGFDVIPEKYMINALAARHLR